VVFVSSFTLSTLLSCSDWTEGATYPYQRLDRLFRSDDPGLRAKAGREEGQQYGHLPSSCMDAEGGEDLWCEIQDSGREEPGEHQQ